MGPFSQGNRAEGGGTAPWAVPQWGVDVGPHICAVVGATGKAGYGAVDARPETAGV